MSKLLESAPKLGIRALKQIVTAIHSLAAFQDHAKSLVEAFERTNINKRYKGLQITLNLALNKVGFSSSRCKLEGEELDTAVEHLFTQALADTERRRAKIASKTITQSLESLHESSEESVD